MAVGFAFCSLSFVSFALQAPTILSTLFDPGHGDGRNEPRVRLCILSWDSLVIESAFTRSDPKNRPSNKPQWQCWWFCRSFDFQTMSENERLDGRSNTGTPEKNKRSVKDGLQRWPHGGRRICGHRWKAAPWMDQQTPSFRIPFDVHPIETNEEPPLDLTMCRPSIQHVFMLLGPALQEMCIST